MSGSPAASPATVPTAVPTTVTAAVPTAVSIASPDTQAGDSCGRLSGEPLPERGATIRTTVLQAGGENTPTVEAAVYPHPPYGGNPWSQWGQGVVLPDGRFISAIGDHLRADGNSYLFEYAPDAFGEVVLFVVHLP